MGLNKIISCFLVLNSWFFSVQLWALSPEDHQELVDYTNFKAPEMGAPKRLEKPRREVSIIVSDSGFYPERPVVFEGEKVKFYITGTGQTPGCFILPSHNLFLSAEKGKVTEGEALMSKAGKYQFHCPTGRLTGQIIVLKKKEDQERAIASERAKKRPRDIWMPRDE